MTEIPVAPVDTAEDAPPIAGTMHDLWRSFRENRGAVGVKIEKRGLNRIMVDVPVYLNTKGKKGILARLKDYSGSGGRLACDTELATDQVIDLSRERFDCDFRIDQTGGANDLFDDTFLRPFEFTRAGCGADVVLHLNSSKSRAYCSEYPTVPVSAPCSTS